jgi:hypothetical protein
MAVRNIAEELDIPVAGFNFVSHIITITVSEGQTQTYKEKAALS